MRKNLTRILGIHSTSTFAALAQGGSFLYSCLFHALALLLNHDVPEVFS